MAFLKSVEDEVLDDYYEEVVGSDAREEVHIEDDWTHLETQFLLNALSHSANIAIENGSFAEAAMLFRLADRVSRYDDDLREDFKERVREDPSPQNMEAFMQQMMGGGGFDPGDGPGPR